MNEENLTPQNITDIAGEIDDTISDLLLSLYENYDFDPVFSLSTILGRMAVVAKELKELKTFQTILQVAYETIDDDTQTEVKDNAILH
jgi:tRNA(Phe) wybutosine-synthesizing methylase Tyw3